MAGTQLAQPSASRPGDRVHVTGCRNDRRHRSWLVRNSGGPNATTAIIVDRVAFNAHILGIGTRSFAYAPTAARTSDATPADRSSRGPLGGPRRSADRRAVGHGRGKTGLDSDVKDGRSVTGVRQLDR